MKRSALRARPPADHSDESGYRTWHAPAWGECSVCRAPDRLVRHHVIPALNAENLAFAVQLYGEDRAAEYLLRYYRVG